MVIWAPAPNTKVPVPASVPPVQSNAEETARLPAPVKVPPESVTLLSADAAAIERLPAESEIGS